MFALSHDGKKFFAHQPDNGGVIPVLIDFVNKEITVRVPSIYELENDYAVFDYFHEAVEQLDRNLVAQAQIAAQISIIFSTKLHRELKNKDLTVAKMRELLLNIWNDNSTTQVSSFVMAENRIAESSNDFIDMLIKNFSIN